MDNKYQQIPYRYAGIIKDDVNNGKGIGLTLFTQYCTHRCKKCQNPSTWSMIGGNVFNEDILDSIIGYFITHKYATRLTISGGDPFDNPRMTKWICKKMKEVLPNIDIWVYSGYTYDEIKNEEYKSKILEYIDVLIDGLYIDELRDISISFRGSTNQRIIDIKKSLQQDKIVLLDI